MAESGSAPADVLEEAPPLCAKDPPKEPIVTTTTGGSDPRAEDHSLNGGAGVPRDEDREATPTPPESSSPSATTEEEPQQRAGSGLDPEDTPPLETGEDEPSPSCPPPAGGLKEEQTAGCCCLLHPSLTVLLSTGGAAVSAPAPPDPGPPQPAPPDPGPPQPAYYLVKWITWKDKKTPVITQSQNGPCPLLAIMNTLFLRWKANLPAQTEVVTTEDLMAHLGECVLSVTPREKTDSMELNFQQNMSDVMLVLPKLSTGLDVNVRFTGVSHFEYTPECIVFDLLDIPLYHGWLVDPQSPEMVAAVGKLSYNQLVEKIIDFKHSADSSRVSEGLVAEQFLEATATQLSYHGLCELNSTAREGELSVFFRNNHFSTMIKHQGHLYLLVTDQGFLQEGGVVWESLHNVEGDGNFCDSDFRLCRPAERAPPGGPEQQRRQVDQDYLVAVSLQQAGGGAGGGAPAPLSDLELARQLQQEEYQQQQGAGPAAHQVRGQGSQPSRRRDRDSDCVLL
ncbi:ubiquitin carboxyl-terminal hydrolase MINDY-1 isoform X3 [Salarias fasciatus]|uniref:ubiquitin carboxyl-terminal hydrolase MINDY-1 isoform X3 n=1 Tax=Salarias fasciatus TaxID=181472 RepID=UPI001176598F|nr:ubiquitin carboxyl-terminal hydrolase MINDY-1 isoform X3 [Salarias fasciatus]